MNTQTIRSWLCGLILAAILVLSAFSIHAQDTRPPERLQAGNYGSIEEVLASASISMDDSGYSGSTTTGAPYAGAHVLYGYVRYVQDGVLHTVPFCDSGLDLAVVSGTFPPGSCAHSMYARHSVHTSLGSWSVQTVIGPYYTPVD